MELRLTQNGVEVAAKISVPLLGCREVKEVISYSDSRLRNLNLILKGIRAEYGFDRRGRVLKAIILEVEEPGAATEVKAEAVLPEAARKVGEVETPIRHVKVQVYYSDGRYIVCVPERSKAKQVPVSEEVYSKFIELVRRLQLPVRLTDLCRRFTREGLGCRNTCYLCAIIAAAKGELRWRRVGKNIILTSR